MLIHPSSYPGSAVVLYARCLPESFAQRSEKYTRGYTDPLLPLDAFDDFRMGLDASEVRGTVLGDK